MTEEQLTALKRFKNANGRTWKFKLNVCWMRALYPGVSDADGCLLQRVRNSIGPSGLVKLKLV